jgi:hypothetical protein
MLATIEDSQDLANVPGMRARSGVPPVAKTVVGLPYVMQSSKDG